jgi:hypothetical protein
VLELGLWLPPVLWRLQFAFHAVALPRAETSLLA